jgi:hypothetical protein
MIRSAKRLMNMAHSGLPACLNGWMDGWMDTAEDFIGQTQ